MAGIQLIFLGTGGGRFATLTQTRRTGGIRILSTNLNVHLDPGPGALIYSLEMKLDPRKVRAILVSHCHPDHYSDAEIFVEAMTRGMTSRRGVLAAPRSVLWGNEVCGPAISKYHQQIPDKVIEVKPGVVFGMNDIEVVAAEAKHTDPDAVGYRVKTRDVGDLAYTSDTEYFEGIGKPYEKARVLLLCVMRPSGEPWRGHMTTNDAVKIVEEVDPEVAVATHFGMKMIFRGPSHEAKLIEKKTGVPTWAASDGMRISVEEEIRVERIGKKQRRLNKFVREG